MEVIICLHCHALIESRYRQTLLGFCKYTCPDCGKTSIYPLPSIYEKIYIGVIVLVTLMTIALLLQGRVGVPGLLFIAGIIALIQNKRIKGRVKEAQEAFLASRKQMEQADSE